MIDLAFNDISISEFEYQAIFNTVGNNGMKESSVKLLTGDVIICQYTNRFNYYHIYPDVNGRHRTSRNAVDILLKTKRRNHFDKTNDH